MSKTPKELRREAAQLRKLAENACANAAYADSAQARRLDEDMARDYERRAGELERRAAELEIQDHPKGLVNRNQVGESA